MYVNGFRRRLLIAYASAQKNLSGAQGKMIYQTRRFKPGDQVLALLPVVVSPFHARFSVPFTVKSQMSDGDFLTQHEKERAVVSCKLPLHKYSFHCYICLSFQIHHHAPT